MYRGIAHLSKKTAGRIGKEKWENKLFLAFSSIAWFCIGGFAAVCCAAAELLITKTISETFIGSVLLIATTAAVFAGFYGGILYLMRRGTFTKKTVRHSGCTVYDFERSREELTFTKLHKESISHGRERMPYERPTSVG